jgi:hypothetical protein
MPTSPTVNEARAPGTTLQSQDLPILERPPGPSGIAPAIVAVLVAVGLAAGFVLGRLTAGH